METKKFSSLESKALQWKRGFLELFEQDFKVDLEKHRDDVSYVEIFTAYGGSVPLQSYAAGIFMMMHVEWPELTREDKKALAEIEGWEQARAWGFRLLGYRTKHCSRFFYRLTEGDESMLVVEHNFDDCPIFEIWLLNKDVEFRCDAQIFTDYDGIFTIHPVKSLNEAKKRYSELSTWIAQGKVKPLSDFMNLTFNSADYGNR